MAQWDYKRVENRDFGLNSTNAQSSVWTWAVAHFKALSKTSRISKMNQKSVWCW